MKKIIILLAIVLFTINASAQQTKPVAKEPAKKESCCAKHDGNAKAMTSAEIAKCQAKCKAEEKKCSAEEMAMCKSDSHAKMTSEELAKCQAKCKAEGKVCTADKKAECKKDPKKCCAKKA
jgi:hypothetical protein